MLFFSHSSHRARTLFFSLFLALFTLPALASDHGAGGGGGPGPLLFTVNLGTENYLQFGVLLETATPELGPTLTAYKAKIQHEIILLLSGKDPGKLRSLAGKKDLVDEIVEAANHVIHETEKTGVRDALFTTFIIQ